MHLSRDKNDKNQLKQESEPAHFNLPHWWSQTNLKFTAPLWWQRRLRTNSFPSGFHNPGSSQSSSSLSDEEDEPDVASDCGASAFVSPFPKQTRHLLSALSGEISQTSSDLCTDSGRTPQPPTLCKRLKPVLRNMLTQNLGDFPSTTSGSRRSSSPASLRKKPFFQTLSSSMGYFWKRATVDPFRSQTLYASIKASASRPLSSPNFLISLKVSDSM